MHLSVAIQMDPIGRIKLETDSTLLLAKEAKRRGHKLYYYEPKHLQLREGEVLATMRSLNVFDDNTHYFELGEPELHSLREMQVILLRQDPPFNMHYLTTTYLLERVHPHTLVVNNPTEVRNCPEKLLITQFPELMPPTLVTEDEAALRDFRVHCGEIIIKPLYAHGGRDIFHVKPGDNNFSAIIESLIKLYGCPVMAQAYVPEVRTTGDKRIVLINGELAGTLTRIPAEGQVRSNMVAGGTVLPAELTERDHEICAKLGPELRKRGLLIAGLDVIGGHVTEINVTSPTGLLTINNLSNRHLEVKAWDAIEETYQGTR